jgi:hypothetical protein
MWSMRRAQVDVGGIVGDSEVEGKILGSLSVLLLGEATRSLDGVLFHRGRHAVPVEADGTQVGSSERDIGRI